MATEQISKILLRSGSSTDLPLLDATEFGYATDVRRLFLGNIVYQVGTGNGVALDYTLDIDALNPSRIAVFVDGIQMNTVDYSLHGTTLTFANPPANGSIIEIKFNSEIDLKKDTVLPTYIDLAANAYQGDTGFAVDSTKINAGIIDYTLTSSNGTRFGQIRFVVDISSGDIGIDDNYVEAPSAGVTIQFNLDYSPSTNTIKLQYTDPDNATAIFKFTYQLWNSNN